MYLYYISLVSFLLLLLLLLYFLCIDENIYFYSFEFHMENALKIILIGNRV